MLMQKPDKLLYASPLVRVRPVGFERVVCDVSQTDYEYVNLDEEDQG